jgi:hypothetical protein
VPPVLATGCSLLRDAPSDSALDQFLLARNNSANPRITSTVAGDSTKNHVVGNHLAKMLESIIIHKPMMAKAAPEKILKVFVAIFFESLDDIHDQRGRLVKKLGFGAVEDEKGEGRRPQKLRILAPNLVKRIFSYKNSRTRSVRQ